MRDIFHLGAKMRVIILCVALCIGAFASGGLTIDKEALRIAGVSLYGKNPNATGSGAVNPVEQKATTPAAERQQTTTSEPPTVSEPQVATESDDDDAYDSTNDSAHVDPELPADEDDAYGQSDPYSESEEPLK
ncbi:MAG: hypothetical protein LBP89_05415 [Helicobacteraceae bacterium]|jgi:hypothetical protein|nr:hypothetical protein [Helicobacteraceae bacterium]